MANEYKIQLGVDLNTSDLKADINKLDDKYKVKLGVDLKVNDIRDRIKQYNTNTNNAKVKLGVKLDTDDIKRQIGKLDLSTGIGKGVSVPVNTQSLEDALKEVKGIISSIQSSIGNVGDGSEFKPLLSSINQIGNALEKTSGKFEELTADLRALTSKDFNVNIGLKLGGNSVNNNAAYSDFVKDEVLPSLEKQERELRNYIAKHFNTNEIMGLNKLAGGELGGVAGIIETLDKLNTPLKKSESLKDRMRDYKNFINTIISSSKIQGIDLSPVLSQFDKLPNELIETADNIRDGVKQTDDAFDKLKQVFGGGNNFNIEGISGQLDSVVSDLNEIRVALQSLSSGNPLSGLTQSFDRLSSSIENLLTNAEKVKGVLSRTTSDVGVDSASDTKIKTENIMPDSSEVVQSAQQVGKKIGETVENAVEQSIDIDDVIDKEVLGLMETFSIAGDRGSNAFKEIRQALIECKNELNTLKNVDIGIDEEVFDTSRAFDKVSDAIANQMRAVNSLGNEYIELAKYMKNFNDPKKGNKVRVPDFIKQEQGDDYKSSRGTLGIAFNTEKGISFASFIEDLNHELGIAIDLTKGEEKAYEELVDKLRLGREQLEAQKKSQNSLQANASTDEILAQNYINKNEIRDVAESSIGYINATEAAERAFAQISIQTANTVVQGEERKQQKAEETANTYEDTAKRIQQANRLVSDSAQNAINGVSSQSIDRAFRVNEGDSLRFKQEMENLVNQWTDGKGELTDIKINTASVFDPEAGRFIEEIRQAQVSYNNELGETIKKTIAWRQIGTKVEMVGEEKVESPLMGFAEVSSQYSKSLGKTKTQTDKFVKEQKKSVSDLTNQINQLNRAASDQNAPRAIKDSSSLDLLQSKYNEIILAIQRMGSASTDTFSDEQNNVRTLISEYKSLVSELRNAENVATSLRSKDISTVKDTYASKLDVLISKMKKDGVYTSGFEKGAENLRLNLSDATDASGLTAFLNGLDKLEAGYKRASAAKKEFNQSQRVGINVSGLESKISDLQRISPEIDKFEAEINGAKVSIQSLLNDLRQVSTQGDFSVINSKFKAFTDAAKAAGIAVADTADTTAIKEINKEISNFIKLQKQIEDTRFNIGKLEISGDSTNQIAELKRELKELEDTYDKLMQAFMKKISINADVVSFNDVVEKLDGGIETATRNAEYRLEQFKAKWADARNELARGIEADIKFGNYEEKMDSVRAKFNNLLEADKRLRDSYEETQNAYEAMLRANETHTDDEIADRERLIQAEKKYAEALEKTENLIKIQARIDKADLEAEKLADKKKALQLDMSNYMKDNTKATREFGDEIKRLSSLLDDVNLDDVGVNKISREFSNLTKRIKNEGKDGLTVFDRLKSKAKEYFTYLSAAEVFMWVEQGLREMFNTVLEIDTAMTGLYRVTDLTASQYDVLFDNMIDSAKEYGATLNDIINATTDWVRAGFEADTALGLANVTTMYQHISDLDYDTAAENLITAYNGFKDELNSAFDGDSVAAVNYIADILNELDNTYAATSAGIGEALTRSASALDLAGNSIQETAG